MDRRERDGNGDARLAAPFQGQIGVCRAQMNARPCIASATALQEVRYPHFEREFAAETCRQPARNLPAGYGDSSPSSGFPSLTSSRALQGSRFALLGPLVGGMSPQQAAFSCRGILQEVRFGGPFAIEIARFSTLFRCQILHKMAHNS